jgi:hypothetical protein
VSVRRKKIQPWRLTTRRTITEYAETQACNATTSGLSQSGWTAGMCADSEHIGSCHLARQRHRKRWRIGGWTFA